MCRVLSQSVVVIGLALLAVISTGCTATAPITVFRPAEFDTSGVRTITVLDFDGPDGSGKIARSELTAQLWSNKHFEIVDQSQLTRVAVAGYVAGHGPPDVSAALEAARRVGIDAILTGQVISYGVVDDVHRSQRFEFVNASAEAKKKQKKQHALGIGFENNETVNREAAVSLGFRLIDVKTGRTIAADTTSHNFTGQVTADAGLLPGREALLTELLGRCVRDTLQRLAPHRQTIKVRLASPAFGTGSKDVRRGNSMAKRSRWPLAMDYWQSVLNSNPDNHAALHNLAIGHEAQHNYPRSLDLLDQALRLDSDDLYLESRRRVESELVQQIAIAERKAKEPSRQATNPSVEVLPETVPDWRRRGF